MKGKYTPLGRGPPPSSRTRTRVSEKVTHI